MKDWWLNLSLREKQTVSLGALGAFILLLYALLWAPLDNKVASMREHIIRNQELLNWMQSADKQLQLLEKKSPAGPSHSTGSLLSVIQTTINKSPLSTPLSQLKQVEADSVQLSFKQVDFDRLILWLAEASQSEGLLVSQMTVLPSETPGIVSAEIILKSS